MQISADRLGSRTLQDDRQNSLQHHVYLKRRSRRTDVTPMTNPQLNIEF